MVSFNLSFQSSKRNARRARRGEAEQPAGAISNLSLRPEDGPLNFGLAMQEAMLGWPQQDAAPSTSRSTVSRQQLTKSHKPLLTTMAQSPSFPMHYSPPSSVYPQPSQNHYADIAAANPYTNDSSQHQQAQLSVQPWLDQPDQFMLPPPALPIPSLHPMAPHSEAQIDPALRRIHTEPAAPPASSYTCPTSIDPSCVTTNAGSTDWQTQYRSKIAALQAGGHPISTDDANRVEIEARGDALQAKPERAHEKAKEELRWREIGFRGRMKEKWARNE